jgi:hypothetical protein
MLMVPILCLPSVTKGDLTPDLMNWTCLVYGGPMLAVLIWWIVDARKWFTGPKVNVEHSMHPVVNEGMEPEDHADAEITTSSAKSAEDKL